MIQTKMNEAICNNYLFRGGIEVEVNSSCKLKFKLNQMNKNDYYYEVPYGENKEITENLLLEINKYNVLNIPYNNGTRTIQPFQLSKSAGIGVTGDTHDYWGVKLDPPTDGQECYFMSPPLNYFGVNALDEDVYNPIVVAEIDLTAITDDVSASINLVGENNTGCYFPSTSNPATTPAEFNEKSFLYDNYNGINLPTLHQSPLKISFIGNIANATQSNINIFVSKSEGMEVINVDSINKAQTVTIKLSVNNNLTDGRGSLKLEMWEQDNTEIFNQVFTDVDLSLFKVRNKDNYDRNYVYNDNSLDKMANMRVAFVGYSYSENIEFPLPTSLAFNYDPQGGVDGFFNDAYQSANALEANTTNTIAPFVVHGDSVFNRLAQYQILINSFTNKAPYESGYTVINQINPNCGTSMGVNEFGFQGTDSNLSTTGMTLVDIINTNSRENALFFISCDDLPLLNYTGNTQTGSLNKFVYAIDFNSGSGSRNNIYTSQPDVEKFNTLTNRQTMRIQNMRIRITNIRGQTVENLDDHTYIVFEIRENPMIRQERLLQKLVSQRRKAQIQKDKIKPTTSQIQKKY